MSSVDCLKDFIKKRLFATTEGTFRAFQTTIAKYEEEINEQRRLLDLVLKPEVTLELQRRELPMQHVCKEEEEEGIIDDQQLWNQESISSQDQNFLTPTREENDNCEDQTWDSSPDETKSAAAEEQHIVIMSVKSLAEPDPNSDDQLLSHSSHVTEAQDHKEGGHGDSGSATNAEPKPKKRHCKSKNHTNEEGASTASKTHNEKAFFICETCGKSFKYKSKLQTHLKVHTGEKPYECNTCEKRFSQLGTLQKHMITHMDEKPYHCDVCEKRFSHMETLKVHMRTHTGEKPYSCNICGRTFRQGNQLKIHMITHTGDKPYSCNTCGKNFSHLETLKVHTRTHTGEKPYPCLICEKRFSQPGPLKVHMRVHTGEKPYTCDTCEKRFSEPGTLKKHMKTHTQEAVFMQDL